MSIADEIRKLDELRQSGALSEEEFARAKEAVLEGKAPDEAVEQVSRRQDVADLDREWEIKKEKYMIRGKYGHRSVPSKGQSVLGGLIVAGFGVFWTVGAFGMSSSFPDDFGVMPKIFPFFGVMFVLFGVGMCVHSYNKAVEYEKAYDEYRRRRAEMLGEDRLA